MSDFSQRLGAGKLQGKEFLSSTAWTVPVGVTLIWVTCVAGGGGGESAASGEGGFGGNIAFNIPIEVSPSDSVTITVGDGGAAGAAGKNPGLPGGQSQVFVSGGVSKISAHGGYGGDELSGNAVIQDDAYAGAYGQINTGNRPGAKGWGYVVGDLGGGGGGGGGAGFNWDGGDGAVNDSSNGTAAAVNTGAGGGGGDNDSTFVGGAGGSGLVRIAWVANHG